MTKGNVGNKITERIKKSPVSHMYIDVHKCLSLNHRKIHRPEQSFGLIYYLLLPSRL